MSFGQSISHVLSNLTNFSGRAGRSEFWWWFLAVIIIQMAANILDSLIGTSNAGAFGMGIISLVLAVVLTLANLSVGCRRLHDTGRSGWWQLLALIPCIGTIILIVWWAAPSNEGANAYGSGPATA